MFANSYHFPNNKSGCTFAGKNCLAWYGPRPAIVIVNPELIREVLTKNYIYQKPPGNPLTRLAANGLAGYEADKWAKHRRLINPAFHLDKLKVLCHFNLC